MNKLLKKLLLFLLPLLAKYFFLLIFIDLDLIEWRDILEDFLFFVIVASIAFRMVSRYKILLNILCFFYVFYIVLETTSYIAVSSNFTSSYMFLLIESNQQELSEFMSSYINFKIIGLLLVLIGFFFILKKYVFSVKYKSNYFLGLINPLLIIVILKLTGLIEQNAYHNIVRGVYGYYDLQNSVKLDSNILTSDLNITSNNEVLVFVLGESTTIRHMEIYGYNKPTTPFLSKIKDSLLVYNNVISTDVLTLKCVPKILTSLSSSTDKQDIINIVQLFNSAGYKTHWLSNQRAISYHDNAISKIASFSHSFKFYNHLIDKHTMVLDEVLLPDYNEILSMPGKKVVFVRLMGTHFDYKNRYPLEFNKFVNSSGSSLHEKTIAEYDNAVLYNDFILHELIEGLRKINTKSALIYLSDHGENVYHEGTDFFGRNEERLTKTMFEIPFLVWTSNTFEFPKDFKYDANRKFMSDHTFESITHLFGVSHKSITNGNSIFSKEFNQTERKVVDYSINFDTYFAN
ncbi:phosphoethanolamine transferase [Neotamlana laminarinivorans]|uniref:Phosphoethanolamine transferase n=1 Tax=Neotamlana laminarinivorans TaxID=2883124 RepID=A0A9X1I3W6_9FLAO|nr:phosphoethanolamine transferase [Tamlana laminarinivorans]MCB4799524.1 phosphoethanolamine transferase [Tamlana laminarinivorans]